MGFLVGYHSFGHGETSGCFHGLGQNELEVITDVKFKNPTDPLTRIGIEQLKRGWVRWDKEGWRHPKCDRTR